MTVTEEKRGLSKNTIYLYMSMFLIMVVTLYISMILLKIFGFEDFGVYNIVTGVVISYLFFNSNLVPVSLSFINDDLYTCNIDEANMFSSLTSSSHIV